MKSQFKDHFSSHSNIYAKFRPGYPDNLFKYLSESSPGKTAALDCATGSGQAAIGLSRYYKQVFGIDASINQITNSVDSKNILYLAAAVENTMLKSECVDLAIAAQALHWFDLDMFYPEMNRILKKNGIFAAWTYNLLRVNDKIDLLIDRLYWDTMKDYWPPERKHVDDGYKELPFPFEVYAPPLFQMEAEWSLEQLTGYLRSWSAVLKFISDNGVDPIIDFEEELKGIWGKEHSAHVIKWPLTLKIGKRL